MAIKLTADSFLAVVKQSGLIEQDQLKRLLQEFEQQGVALENSRAIADQLVAEKSLTRWQADKLLQGRHKGFFLGKYRLLSLLGKGGMSSVYLAEHVLMRRRCAIKVLPSKRVNDSSYLGRFHREAQAVASLDHSNIVRAYDVDKEMERDTEIHFLVMEYVEGQSLHDLVRNNGVRDFVECAEFIRQAAEGLAHAHEARMVHRDVKPGNLLVDTNGVVKILDLGLARFFHDTGEQSLTVTHDEKVLGTADYLAPEQALDSHQVDARADIYSLGCTAYFLLTGHPPFTEGTLAQRLMSHQTKQPSPIERDRPDAPPDLVAIINKMMAKKKEERFQSAAEVAEVLGGWLADNAGDEWRQQHPRLAGSGSGSGSGLRTDSDVAKGGAPPADHPSADDGPAESPAAPPAPARRAAAQTGSLSDVPIAKPVQQSAASPPAAPATPAPSVPEPPSPGPAASQEAMPQEEEGEESELAAFLSNLDSPPPPRAPEPAGAEAADVPAGRERPISDSASDSVPGDEAASASVEREQRDEPSQQEAVPPAVPVAEPRQPPPAESSVPAGAPANDDVPVASPVETAPTGPPAVARAAPVSEDSPAPPSVSSQAADSPGEFQNFEYGETTATAAPPKAPSQRTKSRGARRRGAGAGLGELRARLMRNKPMLTAVVLGAFTVGLVAAGASVFFSGDSDEVQPTAGTEENDGHDASDAQEDGRPDPRNLVGQEITVGPDGHFTTIGEALEYVRRHYNPYSRTQVQTIKVAGGATYRERIVIDNSDFDYPHGIRLVSDGEQKAVLAPSGDGPVVKLANHLRRFVMEGFELKADGQPVAVELAGRLDGTGLRRLSLSGFTQTGIVGAGVNGSGGRDNELLLENLVLHAGDSNAVGIRLQSGDSTTSHLKIRNCRFFGPMSAGIAFEDNALNVDLRESIFSQAGIGLHFVGAERTWREFLIGNNTFHQLHRGIVFSDVPSEQSYGLRLHRNLFSEVQDSEAMIETGFDSGEDYQKWGRVLSTRGAGMEYNWTSRPAPETPKPEEINLFTTSGRRGENFQFASTDPDDPNFLAPTDESPHQQVGRVRGDLKPYIGAVAP